MEVGDPERRIEFCEWFLVRDQEISEFLKIFCGVMNQPIFRNLRTNFNVWVGLINNSIVGLYFYNDNLNGDNYGNILRQMEHDFLVTFL